MDLVTILRDLWRLRVFVLFAGVAAVLAAVVVAFEIPSMESRRHEVGIATASILVDTPRSQVVEVAPRGSDTLGVRANLLSKLMVEGVVKLAIAKKAGLRPNELEGVAESAADPSEPSTASGPSDPRGHVLTTRVAASTDGDLPIIEIEAQAPSAASAAKLADAAVEALRNNLDSKAAMEQVSDAKRLRVTGLGGAQAVETVRGPGLLAVLGVALLIFGLGCAAILVLFAVIRGWRVEAAAEQVEAAEELDAGPSSGLVALDGLLDYDDLGVPEPERSEPAAGAGTRARSA